MKVIKEGKSQAMQCSPVYSKWLKGIECLKNSMQGHSHDKRARWTRSDRFMQSRQTSFIHFFSNHRRPSPFPPTVGASLSFNLPDFSSLSTENGRYCLPFFSGSHSDSNQTRQCIVPLLFQLLVKSGSESLAYIALFCTAMGMLMWMCPLQTMAPQGPW